MFVVLTVKVLLLIDALVGDKVPVLSLKFTVPLKVTALLKTSKALIRMLKFVPAV